jgi:hypothetical protein
MTASSGQSEFQQLVLIAFFFSLPFFLSSSLMPPKPSGIFLMPGTPASKKKKKAPISVAPKSAPAPPVLTGVYLGRNHNRDIVSEFQQEYADPEKLRTELAALVKKHLRPLAPSTLRKHDRTRRVWLAFFEWLYKSADKANATLAENAEFPPTNELKLLIGNLAKKGRSGLQMANVTGWSYHTACNFIHSIEGMVSFFFFSLASFLFLTNFWILREDVTIQRRQQSHSASIC